MNPAEFKDSSAGTLIPTIKGEYAFVPKPLPPTVDHNAIIGPLSEALMAIGELNASGRRIADPYLVIRPLQRLEARLSSALEGTYTTADALALAEADESAAVSDDTREVRNYIRAFDYAKTALEELPISNRLIKGVHRTLLSNVHGERGGNKRPGEFKDQQNFIGGRGRRIKDARFIPPPPRETEDAMADLERYINRPDGSRASALVDTALIHYQFETIHPFGDGNGRVGRILIPIYLLSIGVLHAPLLFISPAIDGRKDEYVDRMLDVSKRGDWANWFCFFLDVVARSARSATSTIDRLEALRRDFQDRIARSGGSARFGVVADSLFVSPVVTIPKVAELMGVTYPAAQNAVKRLTEQEILVPIEGRGQPRRFISWAVIDASEMNDG